MKEKILRKTIVCSIILLFIGAGAATGINSKINRPNINKKILNNSSVITNQDMCSLKFYTFDKTKEKQNNINIPIQAAKNINNKLEELKYMIVYKPRCDETQNVKIEFVDLLDNYGLIPAGLTKDYVLSLLNPSWLKNKQKTPKAKTILSKSYILPITEKIVNLQQIFKNSFGKTILNIFNKNNIILPSGKTTATASFCSISSGGSGKTLPLFLLPRPRAIAIWTASDAITMVGELLTPKGFIAEGTQSGSMLGFTGMGLTYSLPGYIVYGFVGYALYTKVSADSIEFYPPNQEPVISNENPPSGSVDIPLSLSKLSFRISDADGDLMDYTVTTEPNIGSGSGSNKKNGVYTVPISGLESSTKYTWYVVVNDEQSTVENTFSFTTEAVAPSVSDPLPLDNAKNIPIDLSQLSFNLKDFQGDPMDYTVETSPNIGSSSGNDVGDGTYTCDINGLDYQTEYKWYINVTDGVHWTYKVFSFQTELKMVFNPFDEGWQYRKEITINHSMVAGNLINFPVLISTIDSDLRDKAQDDGDDILFMDGSGVADRLYHEIELFDSSTGKLIAWVNVTSLSSSTDTVIWMYYGNLNCSSQQYPTGTWDSNFKARYSMKDLTTSTVDDSTINNYDGIKTAANEPIVNTSGKIGDAQSYDGSNDVITISNSLHVTGQHTISMWIKPTSWTNYRAIFGGRGLAESTDKGGIAISSADGKLYYDVYDSNHRWAVKPNLPSIEVWTLITAAYDGNIMKMFYNGVEQTPSTTIGSVTIDWASSPWTRIGRSNNDLFTYFYGLIDEVRISNVGRNLSWISTEYNNQNDPLGFLSFGPEESGP